MMLGEGKRETSELTDDETLAIGSDSNERHRHLDVFLDELDVVLAVLRQIIKIAHTSRGLLPSGQRLVLDLDSLPLAGLG